MLQLLAKISLLLLALCFHGTKADTIYSWSCGHGFSVQGSDGYCRLYQPDYKSTGVFKCPYSGCWSGDNNKWVTMTDCELIGSPNKGKSKQKCAQYNWNVVKNNYDCTNSGGWTYACPNTPETIHDYISCNDCTEVPKQ
ncbi:uncharacterized protein MELLADRAFT_110917 [Melampsora larici-populina 98AG31]|uniref:Secreted protein n=1 Tax=Melampsora larici-populina (strain 98AG31 / pathotype 3-4-7) TaxID=747676 RepID=F4S1F6_MELLP|nr:uncharacterized protein MELLADRAFT_110917 [Melampsora larici-populina 98AG31]EGG01556.1 secreted protein [Melampsora larici-populina 98AG31]